eukprot:4781184-Amphidinium_carterae.1
MQRERRIRRSLKRPVVFWKTSLVEERGVQKNFTRRNVGNQPRSALLGLYTKRGLGIGKQTLFRLPLLAAIHELARRRLPQHRGHGYTSVMVNDNTALARHRDEYNFGVNYLYGVDTKGQGGELWLSLEPDELPSRVHAADEFELDCDWHGAIEADKLLATGEKAKVATAREAGLCKVERDQTATFSPMTKGAIHPTLGCWAVFDARRAHGVLPFVPTEPNARRISITLFTPRRLHALSASLWQALETLQFPCADVRAAAFALSSEQSSGAARTWSDVPPEVPPPPPPTRKTETRKYGPLKATLLAAGLRHGNAQNLDGCWLRALCGQTAFSCFFLESLQRGSEYPLPPLKQQGGARSHHGLYPCGLPFWSCYIAQQVCPQSGRRLQRWRRGMRARSMVNAAVAYLSWLALGRPWGWSKQEQHPLLFSLSEQQSQMCEQLLHSFLAVCRPGRSSSHPGGGLAHLMTLVAGMASDYHGAAAASRQDPNIALPLVSGQVSLPSCAATVDLQDSQVLPQRLIGYLSDANRLFKSERDLQGPRPQMHCNVENWPTLASDLWQCGLTRWVPTGDLPTIRGALKRSGLFGVAKATGSQLRLIVDRRPANWGEYNLRELLLDDLAKETIDFDEFECLWRLMSLPHAAVLQDIFLGRQGRVQITTEDCSDYFHQLRLPEHLHRHTAVGWSLRKEDICTAQLEKDLTPQEIDATDSFALCLKVVPMGDRKAMEVAQAVHQHIHLAADTLRSSHQLTHGWPLPGQGSVWGSYCDDLALLDFIHKRLRGSCSASTIKHQSRQRLDQVKRRYGEVCLNLKQKEQLRAPEASVWGAVVSSERKDVRGIWTMELLRVRFVTTHTVQKVVGYWVYHCLFQRAGLCILQETYRWLEAGADRLHAPRVLPDSIRQELQGYVLLFPLLKSDLASCINPFLYASDATGEIGAVVKAPMSLPDAVLAWNRRTHHLSPGVAVLEANQLYRLEREERKDQVWEELVAKQSFGLVAKYRFSSDSHINVKELMAVRTALRHIVRDTRMWQTRAIIAVDSQVAVWALKKGRSSSRALNQVLQTMLGDLLSTNVRLAPVWIATECNPADAPTRRRKIPPAQRPGELFHAQQEHTLAQCPVDGGHQ